MAAPVICARMSGSTFPKSNLSSIVFDFNVPHLCFTSPWMQSKFIRRILIIAMGANGIAMWERENKPGHDYHLPTFQKT